MKNPVPLRLVLALLIMIAVGAAVAAIIVINFLIRRKEKSAHFEIYYRTARKLGTPLSFADRNAAFEKNGTRFEAEFPEGEHSF